MNRAIWIAATLTLGACAAHSGIVPMGDNAYMVSKQQATGFPGIGNMKAEILAEASQFCDKQGKAVKIATVTQNDGPYVLGKYPRVEAQFSCVPHAQ